MSQFLEHRAKYLILSIIILSFINIAEIYMLGGEVRLLVEDMTAEEAEEFLETYTTKKMKLDNQIEDLWILLLRGDITPSEYTDAVVPLENERYRLTNKYITAIGPSEINGEEGGINIGNVVVGIFTIQIPDAPDIITLILSLINTILILISALIIASFVYDIVKALPFT